MNEFVIATAIGIVILLVALVIFSKTKIPYAKRNEYGWVHLEEGIQLCPYCKCKLDVVFNNEEEFSIEVNDVVVTNSMNGVFYLKCCGRSASCGDD